MLPCKDCFEFQLTLMDNSQKQVGCVSCLSLPCNSSGWTETFYTSKKNGRFFEINRRMVHAMRSVGCGRSTTSRFCSTMNMPPSVETKSFSAHTKAILRAAKDVAEQTMKEAVQEIYNSKSKKDGDIVETCDGSWKRRGFSSLHGCVTVISMENRKNLDVEPLSKVWHVTRMKMTQIQLNVNCGKLNINQSVKQITLDHNLQWNRKGLYESLIVLFAAIISSILNFMGMVTARVSVLLKIYTRMITMWLFKKKNV